MGMLREPGPVFLRVSPTNRVVECRHFGVTLDSEALHQRKGVLMSRTWKLARIACCVALTIPVLTGQARAGDKDLLAKGKLGTRIVTWVRESDEAGFSGVIFASHKGKPVAAVGVGSADLAGKVPNTATTLFEIASATKQITAAAILRLADEGKLTLDDSISKHLPGVPENCHQITVRHLLQHTSGIPGSNSRGGGVNLNSVLKAFLKGGPQHKPGTHWEYWNQGYSLLSEVIARASGKPYTKYCRDALFAPSKMKYTLFTGDRAPKKVTVAVGSSKRGAPRSALDHPYGAYGFQYRGMGGCVTTVWDLWRWDRALAGRLLSSKSKKALFTPGLNDYALGWYVKNTRGRQVQSHSGSVRGFICEVRRYPKTDSCVFVLCNRNEAPMRLVADGIEQLLFGEKLTVQLPKAPDAALAKKLEGTFTTARGHLLDISTPEREPNSIYAILYWKTGPVSRLKIAYAQDGKLAAFQGSSTLKFEIIEEEKGRVKSLKLEGDVYVRE